MKPYLPAIFLILLSVAGFSYAILKPKSPMGQFAAVYPPNSHFNDNFASIIGAGAKVVRLGSLSNIIIVQSDDAETTSRLRNSGAVVLLNPLIEGACIPRVQNI